MVWKITFPNFQILDFFQNHNHDQGLNFTASSINQCLTIKQHSWNNLSIQRMLKSGSNITGACCLIFDGTIENEISFAEKNSFTDINIISMLKGFVVARCYGNDQISMGTETMEDLNCT